MSIFKERITLLRSEMHKHSISAYIITGTDPHLSEYIPDYWQEREFISGFTGSAGKVVITHNKAALWTDSRYFLQASSELEGSGIELMKMGLAETPDINNWLISNLEKEDIVGINPLLISASEFLSTEKELNAKGLQFVASPDLISEVWEQRPALPKNEIILLEEDVTGESTASKLARLRTEMNHLGADYYMLSALDEIAWTFNLRGQDISFNPVTIAYALVGKDSATIFIDEDKIGDELCDVPEIHCVPIGSILHHIGELPQESKIIVDASKLNFLIYDQIESHCQIISSKSWPNQQKAQKNTIEIRGFKQAMILDGIALVRFFMWLENAVNSEEPLTEYTIGTKLRAFRAAIPGFMDESFSTISGYNGNGAIVHYSAPQEGSAAVRNEGILLLDSGGQYFMGTTDITRTVALGAFPEEAKTDYTLVLKGHLALSTASFPENTRGSQLDVLARQFLWTNNLDYGHGTGHGVGHFLNVHEGPQSIRKEENPVTLKQGMVLSNEPGVYRANKYGIRIENLLVVQEKETNDFGTFYHFETLTLFPYDLNMINTKLLNKVEIAQINTYHQTAFEALKPYLSQEETVWLHQKTQEIPQR